MSTPFCFTFACDLKEDTPQQVIDTLKFITRTNDGEASDPPDETFPNSKYWRDDLRCDNAYFYFPGEAGTVLRSAYRYNRSANQGGAAVYLYTFSFRCVGKDDSLISYGDIVEWLAPYSATSGYVGNWYYEDSEILMLIYIINGQARYSEVPNPV